MGEADRPQIRSFISNPRWPNRGASWGRLLGLYSAANFTLCWWCCREGGLLARSWLRVWKRGNGRSRSKVQDAVPDDQLGPVLSVAS